MTADEYERFVRNNWSWMGQFIRGSSNYSATAGGKLAEFE